MAKTRKRIDIREVVNGWIVEFKTFNPERKDYGPPEIFVFSSKAALKESMIEYFDEEHFES